MLLPGCNVTVESALGVKGNKDDILPRKSLCVRRRALNLAVILLTGGLQSQLGHVLYYAQPVLYIA